MSEIVENLLRFRESVQPKAKLVAVSKTKPVEDLREAYDAGQRLFGENKVQEMAAKHEELPKDIEWHMIGHVQRNKVKYMAPFVALIHSVDSPRLLREINKQGKNNDRVINCLLQVHIADEESKFGFDTDELLEFLSQDDFKHLEHIQIRGLMGMATLTDDQEKVRSEFKNLNTLFRKIDSMDILEERHDFSELSMGMTGDYKIALDEGSTMVRIGSAIFGARN